MENNLSQKGTTTDTKWERRVQPSQNDILTNNYMNNLRADAALRAENLSDTELLNAYERNESAYQTEKRMKNAPKIEDKSPFIIKVIKKPLQWVIEQIKAVADVIKAGMLRVALGTEGVNRVIENTRKDDEKAERKALQEKEVQDLDKNAVREELRKRMHSTEKSEEVGKGAYSPETTYNEHTDPTSTHAQNGQDGKINNGTKEIPAQDTNEQKKISVPEKSGAKPSLGLNDKNRLDRMYLGATDKDNDSQYKEFKQSIETDFKKNYGINLMLKAVEKDKESKSGYLQFSVNDKELGFPTIKYMGHGNVVIEGGDKSKTEQVKNLISHYINSYDKDSQKSRIASGIYPDTKEITLLLEQIRLQQGKDSFETQFYGITLTGARDAENNYVIQIGNREDKKLIRQNDINNKNVAEWLKIDISSEINHVLKEAYEQAKENNISSGKPSMENTDGPHKPTAEKNDEDKSIEPEIPEPDAINNENVNSKEEISDDIVEKSCNNNEKIPEEAEKDPQNNVLDQFGEMHNESFEATDLEFALNQNNGSEEKDEGAITIESPELDDVELERE